MKVSDGYFILMADIIESKALTIDAYSTFKEIVERINQKFASKLFSPLTITLGDEFQGIVKNRKSGIEIILALEEELLISGIRMRYAFGQGIVETPINTVNAHGMVGPGLTKTRQNLEAVKNSDDYHSFDFRNPNESLKMELAFRVYRSIVDDWFIREGDPALAYDFLKMRDYKIVAEKHQKDNSSIWRKGKSLKIREYLAMKDLILLLSGVKVQKPN